MIGNLFNQFMIVFPSLSIWLLINVDQTYIIYQDLAMPGSENPRISIPVNNRTKQQQKKPGHAPQNICQEFKEVSTIRTFSLVL